MIQLITIKPIAIKKLIARIGRRNEKSFFVIKTVAVRPAKRRQVIMPACSMTPL